MRKTLFLLVILTLVFAAGSVSAAEVKIGYVDLQKAINASVEGKKAKEQISKKVQEYEGQVDQRKQELQTAKEKLEKEVLLLSDDARASRERDYQQKVKDFQRFTKDIQEELQLVDADLTKKILSGILKAAAQLGADEKFTAIFEKNESSLVYADPSIDLTERVIKLYNASQK
jgi:outer membrane protein